MACGESEFMKLKDEKSDVLELDDDAKFLFYTMMQAAITMKEVGSSKEDYLAFANGIWETLELNDLNELKDTLQEDILMDF